jgi:hypothetical protein
MEPACCHAANWKLELTTMDKGCDGSRKWNQRGPGRRGVGVGVLGRRRRIRIRIRIAIKAKSD